MKILIIDDEPLVVIEEIKQLCDAKNIEVIIFEPTSFEKKELYSQLKSLCYTKKFDLALLDYKLWFGGEFLGEELIPILKQTETPFVGFSNIPQFNQILVNKGARTAILKNKTGFEIFNNVLDILS